MPSRGRARRSPPGPNRAGRRLLLGLAGVAWAGLAGPHAAAAESYVQPVSVPAADAAAPEVDAGAPEAGPGEIGPAEAADAADANPEPATFEPPPLPDNGSSAEHEVVDMLSAIKGQDLSEFDLAALLENVVVTATKSEIGEDRAPAVTTVIGREEIQTWGYQSVDEILRHVAGFYIVNDHIIPNLAVRGISGGLRSESGLVKVMIDGQSVSFRSTAGNWLGPELVPLSAVQQIEIIRGPASSLYGADAFLAVINIVTRRPDQMQGGEIALVANHQGGTTWGQDMAVGAGSGAWQFLASLRTGSEDRSGLQLPASSPSPKLPSYAPADLRARDMILDSTVALARLKYLWSRHASLALTGYLSEIHRAAEFADWEQLTHSLDSNGRRNGTNISLRQAALGLYLETPLVQDLDLRVSGQGFYGGPTSRDRIEVGSDLFYVRRDFGYRGFDVNAEVAWRPSEDLQVLLGAGMILDDEKLPTVYDVLKTSLGSTPGNQAGDEVLASTATGDEYLSNVGANALVMWSPMEIVTFTGGLRYDRHSVYGDKVSGRLVGVATLHDNLHLKILYGSAFKAPSPQLLYGSPIVPGDIAGNDELRPSYVHTVETQLSYRPDRYLQLKTGLAYSYLLDQATFAQRGINEVALNMSRVGSLSWETELRFDYRRKIAAYANLTLNRTVLRLDEDNFVADLSSYANAAYPVLVANAGGSATVPRLPLRASAEISYVSRRRSSGANTLEAGRQYELPGYLLIGGTIRTMGLELFDDRPTTLVLVVRNVADVHYADPGFAGVDYPQLGRTALLQVVQEF
ncbi:MAG: TonB-dependent receptor [Deltaproteobacteria bacterium]|nr:TonB-dependent receptor [Deltaproteobacteria bacterium]